MFGCEEKGNQSYPLILVQCKKWNFFNIQLLVSVRVSPFVNLNTSTLLCCYMLKEKKKKRRICTMMLHTKKNKKAQTCLRKEKVSRSMKRERASFHQWVYQETFLMNHIFLICPLKCVEILFCFILFYFK